MARMTQEEKLVKQIHEALDNHWFNIPLFVQLLVDENPYYNNLINDMVEHIIHKQASVYPKAWEHDLTCDGLMRSSYLSDVIKARDENAYRVKKEMEFKQHLIN